MDEKVKKILMIIGIIVAIFLFVKFVIPFIFKLLGIALSILSYVLVGIGIILLIGFVLKLIKNNS